MAIYTSKDIDAGGVHVAVRQRLGHGSSLVPQEVAAAVVSARFWLNQAIASLRDGTPDTSAIFHFCFHADPTPGYIQEVGGVLMAIRMGLSSPFGIKVRDMHGMRQGYVRREIVHHGMPSYGEGGVVYDEAEDEVRIGEIHLDEGMLHHGDDAARLLIHEAGHKFANLRDHGEHGYHYRFEDTHITWEQARSNADSYAVFAYLMANKIFAHARCNA